MQSTVELNITNIFKDSFSGSAAILWWAKLTPSNIAVQYGEIKYTYGEMALHLAKYIKSLELFGVKSGQLVGIECDHTYLHLLLNLAVEAIGASHTAISKYSSDNNAAILGVCEVLLVQNLSSNIQKSKQVLGITNAWINEVALLVVDNIDLERLARKNSDNQVVMLCASSGTTGMPKFFEEKRGAFNASVNLFEDLFFKDHQKINFITVYSMSVGASFAGAITALKVGSTIVITFINQFMQAVAQYPMSHSALTVRDTYFLQKEHSPEFIGCKLGSLRVFGAALPTTLRQWLMKYVADRVISAYSSTEAGLIAEIDKDGVGHIYPNAEVQIVDENIMPVPLGKPGLLLVKSNRMIHRYLWNENLTKQHFLNGWFLTSDCGYKVSESQIVILGRNDDLLNLGGLKVSPYLMEDKIKAIDGVSDCILANPKESSVGVVYVCIEREDLVCESGIIDLIRPLLNYDNELIYYFFFKKFSRTKTGKIKRIELLQEISQGKIRSY